MTAFGAIFAVATEPSVGVPTLRTSPNAIMKSIESDDVNALENVICEPEIVNDEPGF